MKKEASSRMKKTIELPESMVAEIKSSCERCRYPHPVDTPCKLKICYNPYCQKEYYGPGCFLCPEHEKEHTCMFCGEKSKYHHFYSNMLVCAACRKTVISTDKVEALVTGVNSDGEDLVTFYNNQE